MLSRSRRFRPRSSAVLMLMCSAMWGGCDSRELVAPATSRAHPRQPARDEVLASGSFPVGGTSSADDEAAYTQTKTLGALPENTWVVVNESGSLTLTLNPDCVGSPYFACDNGPVQSAYGDYPDYLGGPVTVAHSYAGGAIGRVSMRAQDGGGIGLFYQDTPGELWANVNLVPRIDTNVNTSHGTGTFFLSGSFSVSAHSIPSPLVFTTRALGDSLDSVEFTVAPYAGLQFITQYGVYAQVPGQPFYWRFVPGDSVDMDAHKGGGGWDLWDCYNKTSCTIPLKLYPNGRMQVGAMVEAQFVEGRSDYVDAQPSTCGGISASRSSRRDLSVMNCREPAELLLSCHPDSLLVGMSTTCAASVSPSTADLTVGHWQFTGDSLGIAFGADGDTKTWTIKPTVCGTVSVTGTVDGALETRSTHVEVFCNMLDSLITDTLLNKLEVQRALRAAWSASHPYDPDLTKHREQGGYILQDQVTGQYSIIPMSSNLKPDVCQAFPNGLDLTSAFQQDSNLRLVGIFHTHPQVVGQPPPPNCHAIGANNPDAQIGDGVSKEDYHVVNLHNHAWDVPSYIVDFDHVHRALTGEKYSNTHAPWTRNRSKTCP